MDGLPSDHSEVTLGVFGHCLFSVRLSLSRNTKLPSLPFLLGERSHLLLEELKWKALDITSSVAPLTPSQISTSLQFGKMGMERFLESDNISMSRRLGAGSYCPVTFCGKIPLVSR